MNEDFPVTRSAIGAPLGQEGLRRRSIGRIGGYTGTSFPEIYQRLQTSLGFDSQILGAINSSQTLVADYDACWFDGTQISSTEIWQEIIDRSRLADVRGAFALAWQNPDGSTALARDAIGDRSLFYTRLPHGFLFSSTLHGILATQHVERKLNLSSVASYLAYAYIPGRETLVQHVYELLPGECVQYKDGTLTREIFWAVPGEKTPLPEEELRARLRSELEDSVRRRLLPDQPMGAFLSGGLDSSLVVALACVLHSQPLHTYSITFGAGHANELEYSNLLAKHCRTKHRIVELPPPTILHYLDDTIRMFSKPNGDPLTVPNALLFREAAADTGAILNGEGGDPCFGGPKNLPMLLAELYGGMLSDEDAMKSRAQSYLRAHLKCFDDLPVMLTNQMLEAIRANPLEDFLFPYFEDPRWKTFINKLQAMNIIFKGGHHILPKVDAVSAPQGMLARSPLFDQSIVEFSFLIPPQLKLKGSVEKYLLKQAVRDLVPDPIIERPKSGMLVPVESWFQGPLLSSARERLLDGLSSHQLIERKYLEDLLAGKLGGARPRRGAKIWLLITLEAWLRTVFKA